MKSWRIFRPALIVLGVVILQGIGQEAGRQDGISRGGSPALAPESQGDVIFGLKPGTGREYVLGYCMPCHSTTLVASNHMSRERWDATIDTMQIKNGMTPIPPDIRDRILDYLEVAQRVDDPGLNASRKSPWASPLYRPNPLW
ncbi:MAG: hypothetical protein LR011_11675 [Verrucomicrobia bacterium]|nr:hypothetical protein [Verrucomicrobiota bacterium]